MSIQDDDIYLFNSIPLIPTNDEKRFRHSYFVDTLIQLKQAYLTLDLMQGRTEGLFEDQINLHRFSTLIQADSTRPIDVYRGAMYSEVAIEGMELLYLNGYTTSEQIHEAWPALDEAFKYSRDSFEKIFIDKMGDRHLTDHTIAYQTSMKDFPVRHKGSQALIAVLHSTVALRFEYLKSGKYPALDQVKFELLTEGLDSDPFSSDGSSLRIRNREESLVIYSVGPNGEDDQGAFDYDPTNGVISPGDIRMSFSRERKFPFPPAGELATTRDEILAQFPNGLPEDPFARTHVRSLTVTDTVPVFIMSWGPDQFNDLFKNPILKRGEIIPAGAGVMDDGGAEIYAMPNLQPEVQYDPTNGLRSNGDLWFAVTPDRQPYDPTNGVYIRLEPNPMHERPIIESVGSASSRYF